MAARVVCGHRGEVVRAIEWMQKMSPIEASFLRISLKTKVNLP